MDWNLGQICKTGIQLFYGKNRTSKRRRGSALFVAQKSVEVLESRVVLTVSPEEQLFVYLLNRARHDPQAYEVERGLPVSLDDVLPQPPLAINQDLFDSAEFHANEMADNNYFDHQSQVTGDWPNKMARDEGYVLPAFFDNDANFIESIAAGNAYGGAADVLELLIVDEGVPSLGHRKHLLGIGDFYEDAREIGVGHDLNLSSIYDHYWAAHITYSNTSDKFLTGVVYNDLNGNQRYDLNEGLPEVTVSLVGDSLQTLTNAAGGWAIKVTTAKTYTVNVSGVGFVGTGSASVEITNKNREVDFISGRSTGIVDFNVAPTTPNLAPANSLPAGPLLVQEDIGLTIPGVSLADPDAGTAPVIVTLSVTAGTLRVPTNITSGLTGTQVSGNNSNQITLTGSIAQINTTLASAQGLIYQANANYSGSDTLTMVSNDQGNLGTGGALSDTDSLEITVSAVNDSPVNSVPAGTISVVTSTSVALSGIGIADADIGGNSASVTLSVLHGNLTLRTDVVGGLTVGDITNNGTSSLTIVAPLSKITASLSAPSGLQYQSVTDYVGAETLTILTSDQGSQGAGGAKTDQDSVNLNVTIAPVAPSITVPGTGATSSDGKEVVIGTGITISDLDTTDFSGGRLTVRISAGALGNEVLTVAKVGKKSGQVNLQKGTRLRLGKEVIGTVSNGTSSTPLVIQFEKSVSLSVVQTVLQNISLRANKKKLAAGVRTIEFTATDPSSLVSVPQFRTVTV